MLTREQILEVLDYDPEIGEFFWKERPEEVFGNYRAYRVWNSRYAGKRAGGINHNGDGVQRRIIRVNKKGYKEHQLVWILMSDDPLPDEIDHSNRNPLDNRWVNLKGASKIQNQQNRTKNKNNTSGVTGVNFNIRTGKWLARVCINGRSHYLGLHDDLLKAESVVKKFRRENGFDLSHGEEVSHLTA